MVHYFIIEPVSKRPLSKSALICPISASPMSGIFASTGSNFNPRNTLCIPVVKIFAFLDFEQISADFEIEHFETGSIIKSFFVNENHKSANY
ncbi:MAG: hypothetical protein BBJ57_10230 [Desulfobacterales bacterium PC51MH44]|nr:MAG: hypothetical protein BBJ57_10230 [Desulfobacterales bacterium PC51MH44]